MGKKRGKNKVVNRIKRIKHLKASRRKAKAKHKTLKTKKRRQKHKAHKIDILEKVGFEIKDEIPLGIKVLTLYTLFLALVYLFAAIASPVAIVLGNLIAGATGRIVNLVYVGVLLILASGFATRQKWVWKFSLVWYSYSMIDALVSGFSINAYFDLLMNLIVTFLLFTFLANAIMLWYVHKKRTYFIKHSHPRLSKEDKTFITLIILVVMFFTVIAVLSTAKLFYDTSKMVNDVILDLKTAFPGEENSICRSKDLPERDVCYLTLSIMKKNTEFCRAIVSDFYKITCYRGDLLKAG